jgi:lipopolysaccharide transport system permease protein
MSIQDIAEDNVVWLIRPSQGTFFGQLAALWRHKNVSVALARQVIANDSERTLMGIPWILIQPLVFVLPAVFVLGKVFNVSVAPLPLPMFIVSGFAAWIFVRRGVQLLTRSLNLHRSLIRRLYIPPFLLLCASLSPAIVQFLVLVAILAALAIFYGPIVGTFYIPFGWHLFGIVPALLLLVLLVIAVGCFTCILFNLRQDTRLVLRYVLSGWMLITPIIYPPEIIPESHRWLLYLNPLTPLVELFRYTLLGYGTINTASLCLAVMVILVMLVTGATIFTKMQNRLFDHI